MKIPTNIPQGYKSSPLGIIPKDWEVKRLGEVCRFLQTNTCSRAQMCDKGGEVNNIHYGDILTKYRSILDVRKTCIPFLLEENNVCNVLLQNGDIVMADTAEDEMVGKVCEIFGITKEKVVAGLHTIALRPQSKMFAACYLGYYMDSTCFHSRLIPYMQGIKVYSLTKSVIENSIIPLPPLAEQERIAELLGTWDRAIEMQKQLIDKLELRKKGLMQQLLTGKKRLPGFTDEWKKVRFSDLYITVSAKKYQIPTSKYEHLGKYPIIDQGQNKIIGFTNEECVFTNLPIIVFGDHTRVVKWVNFQFVIGADGVQLLTTTPICDIKLGYYILCNTRIKNLGYSRHLRLLKSLSFTIPSSIEEQLRLTQLFSVIDDEIINAIQKLNSLQAQKKGLMQVLLTGKKRI